MAIAQSASARTIFRRYAAKKDIKPAAAEGSYSASLASLTTRAVTEELAVFGKVESIFKQPAAVSLQGRVTDHRVGATEHDINAVMAGERLHVFTEALTSHHKAQLLDNLGDL